MITKITEDKQKVIVTGLIVSSAFCKKIVPILGYNQSLTKEIFSNFSRIIIKWCIEYYKKYNKAPKEHIQKIYEENYEKSEYDEEDYTLIASFLDTISKKYERLDSYNEQFVIDESLTYLRKKNLTVLREQISSTTNVDEAEKYVQDYNFIRRETDKIESFDLFHDIDHEIDETFNDKKDRLFKLPGTLGDRLGYFQREDLISFLAPAKRGKSWALQEIAIVALMQQLRIVFFSFEMSKRQCKQRLYQGLVAELNSLPKGKNEQKVKIPQFVYDDNVDRYTIEYTTKTKTGLTKSKIKRKIKALETQVRGGYLKYITPPAFSMTVPQMKNCIRDIILEDEPPDVIIVDYADIILPEKGKEYRHQIDSNWKGLKGMAQEFHCAVFTASHSGKTTFDKDINEDDVVEDQRKMNHVSMMLAINQTPKEKERGIGRMSILVHRHRRFNKLSQIVFLQNLDIGKFMLDNKNQSLTTHTNDLKRNKGNK